MSLSSMVLEAREADSPMARMRQSLSDENCTALEQALIRVREYTSLSPIACSATPFETLLLLMLEKQNQRIECMEFLLRQNAIRMLEK